MKKFDEIYEELQSAENNELNQAWQEAKKQSEKAKKISGIICIIIDALIVMLFLKNISSIGQGTTFLIFYIIAIALIIDVIIFLIVNAISGAGKRQMQFNSKYKKIVINKLMNNFYDNLEYFPNKPMPEYIYKQLEYEYYDTYISDDYFEALINNKNSIQMAEILTQEERTHKNKDGETETEIITKFHGLFAKVEMDKSINSELRIMQNGAMILDKRLKMDSSEFEKYFDVKASNKIIGMQLLTADVMEELVEFQNKTNMKFDIFIKGKELYLRFHSGEMFESGNLKNGALDKNTIQKYFYMLNFTYNLSNRLINLVNDTQI